jgi:hypothetical protein
MFSVLTKHISPINLPPKTLTALRAWLGALVITEFL